MAPITWPLSSRATAALVSLVPVAVPAVYALYFHYSVVPYVDIFTKRGLPLISSTVEQEESHDSSTQKTHRHAPTHTPTKMPAELPANAGSYYEHIESRPVAASELPSALVPPPGSPPSALLTAYARISLLAHARTLSARLMVKMVPSALKQTFLAPWINQLPFKDGDVANGLYRVVFRGSGQDGGKMPAERVEMELVEPEGWTGPHIQGFVVLAAQEVAAEAGAGERQFVFVNNIWVWREKQDAPVFFDFGFGRWIHKVTSGWLLLDAVASLKAGKSTKLDRQD